MADVIIIRISLNEIPDEAIVEYDTKSGRHIIEAKLKLCRMKQPDKYGWEWCVVADHGAQSGKDNVFVGKARNAVWSKPNKQSSNPYKQPQKEANSDYEEPF